MISTITALILGLITASAKSSFDEVHVVVTRAPPISSYLTASLLATALKPAVRSALQQAVARRIDMIWP